MIDIASKIPPLYSKLLPVCPCGCKGLLPGDRKVQVPQYVDDIRAKHGDFTWLAIERTIIKNEDWREDPLVHHMRHILNLFPWIAHDPNLVRMMTKVLELEDKGINQLHMMGYASSGKTNFMVLDAIRTIDIWPETSECFVASPYRNASEYLLWEAFTQTVDRLKDRGYPIFRKAASISRFQDRKAGPGSITLVSFHSVGVLRGKKLNSQTKGQLGVYLDEAGEFSNESILEILANLKSQPRLRVRTGTNFRNISGLDGKFHQPLNVPWSKLNRELDYEWEAVNGGYSIRFRAKAGPNIVMGQDYYPYLLTDQAHNELLKYGEDSPYYLSQGDAFPSVSSINRLLISESDVVGGAFYDDVDLAPGSETFAFLDPSFSEHGDAAIIATGELGYARQISGNVEQKIRLKAMDELPINATTKWNDHWLELAKRLRQGKELKPTFVEGELIDAFDLAALLTGEYLLENNISANNFAFDDSMRGKLASSMHYFLGEGAEAVFYGGSATNKLSFPPEYQWKSVKKGKITKRERVRMAGNELYYNIVAQMWFTTVAMIKAGYVRNGYLAQKAVDQLTTRLRKEAKSDTDKKLGLETKKDYKDRNRNESPDHADAICGLIHIIVDRKLAPTIDRSEASVRQGWSVAQQSLAMAESGELRRKSRIPKLSR